MRQPQCGDAGTRGRGGMTAENYGPRSGFCRTKQGHLQALGPPGQDPAASGSCWCGLTLMSPTDAGRKVAEDCTSVLLHFRKPRAGHREACWGQPEPDPGSVGPLKAPDSSLSFGPLDTALANQAVKNYKGIAS